MHEKERTSKDLQRSKVLMEQLEQKHSMLKEELVDVKEKFNRSQLTKDVLEQEKLHLTEILSKTEIQREDIEAEGM